MSRSCDLTGVSAMTGKYVPVNRSQTGVRTNRTFSPNIQKVRVLSDALGKVSLKLAVKTIRSIEHNGGLDQYLLTISASKLTTKGKALQKQIAAKTSNENKASTEKPIRRQDKKSPRSLAAAKIRGGNKNAVKTETAKPVVKKAKKSS